MLRSAHQSRVSVCLLVLPLLGACGGLRGGAAHADEPVLGAETPEALIERVQGAAARQDMAEMAACLDRQGRIEMAQSMYVATTLMVAFSGMAAAMGDAMGATDEAQGDEAESAAAADSEALVAAFDAMSRKYGLPGLEDDEEPAGSIDEVFGALEDRQIIGMLTDMGTILKDFGADPSEDASPISPGTLESIQIDGDTATATIDGEVGELVREGGRWFIKSSSAENLFGGAGDDSGSMEGSSSGSSAEAPRPEDTLTPLDLGRPLRAEILPHESLFVGTWFSFSAPESGSYTVTVVGVDGTEESTDLVIESFLDGDYDTTIARSDSDIDGSRAHEQVTLDLAAGGRLDLKVRMFGGGSGATDPAPIEIRVDRE